MKFQYLSFATLFCALLSHFSVGLRIFGCFPYTNRSQYIVGLKLLKELAARGHEVSIMAHYLSNDKNKNFKFEISMGPHNDFEDHMNLTGLRDLRELSSIMKLEKKSLNSFHFRRMVAEVKRFDIVIVDYIMNDAILGFGHFFNASIVVLSNYPGYEAKLVGAETLPYGTAVFRYDYSSVVIKFAYMFMRTFERCFMFEKDEFSEQEALYNDIFPDPKPSLAEVKNRVSLVLLYTHLAVHFPRLTAPNVIPVGGFHIDDSTPPFEPIASLDETLVLDEVKEGIIYVSLGRTFYDHPESKRIMIDMLDAFGKLQHSVLWSWEYGHNTPISPKNVLFNSFVEQKEILNHTLTKLFISDMGHLSHMEAIHFGVPVLALPSNLIGHHNQQFAVEAGMGLAMDLDEITTDTFLRNVKMILVNPKYADNAKLQSAIFRDRIVNPLDTAVYWIEYVAKFEGAKHLRVNPNHLALLLFESIDIFVILFYVIFPICIWIGFTCYCCYRVYLKSEKENFCENCEENISERDTPVRCTLENGNCVNCTVVEELSSQNIIDESTLAEHISAESDNSEGFSPNSSHPVIESTSAETTSTDRTSKRIASEANTSSSENTTAESIFEESNLQVPEPEEPDQEERDHEEPEHEEAEPQKPEPEFEEPELEKPDHEEPNLERPNPEYSLPDEANIPSTSESTDNTKNSHSGKISAEKKSNEAGTNRLRRNKNKKKNKKNKNRF